MGGEGGRWESQASLDEATRVLAVNVWALLEEHERRSLLITSAREQEGRSTTCVRLARVFASRGMRVVVIDADLRTPSLHRHLDVPRTPGVTEVVAGDARLATALRRVPVDVPAGAAAPGLYVLPAGGAAEDPDELLSRDRFDQVLARLGREADVVLIDGPPVLPVADALTLGRSIGAALVVLDVRRTGVLALQRARDLLERSGTTVVGLVVNQVRAGDAGASEAYGISRPGGAG